MKFIEFAEKFIAIDKIQAIYVINSPNKDFTKDLFGIGIDGVMISYNYFYDDVQTRNNRYDELLSQLKVSVK